MKWKIWLTTQHNTFRQHPHCRNEKLFQEIGSENCIHKHPRWWKQGSFHKLGNISFFDVFTQVNFQYHWNFNCWKSYFLGSVPRFAAIFQGCRIFKFSTKRIICNHLSKNAKLYGPKSHFNLFIYIFPRIVHLSKSLNEKTTSNSKKKM